MDSVLAVVIALISGGIVGFFQFLIQREDKKKDKSDEILAAIKDNTKKIESLESRMDKENADESRRNILAFDDELRRGIDHSEESFNQVLQDIRYYRNFCRTHEDYENDKAVSAIAHIREIYQCVKNENKFI